MPKRTGLYERIYTVARQIPAGKVSTYGQIAAIVGKGCTAREAGYAMAALKAEDTLTPWHRVINAQGRISPRSPSRKGSPTGTARRKRGRGGAESRQRRLLEREGVRFSDGRVDFARYRWSPFSDDD